MQCCVFQIILYMFLCRAAHTRVCESLRTSPRCELQMKKETKASGYQKERRTKISYGCLATCMYARRFFRIVQSSVNTFGANFEFCVLIFSFSMKRTERCPISFTQSCDNHFSFIL